MRLFYRVVRIILKGLFKLLYNPIIIGKDNIPIEGSLVLASNHTKWLDPLLIISIVNREVSFLAKKELFSGITKPIMKLFNCVPVDRSKHDKDALSKAYDILNEEKIIGIFPEGTISKNNKLLPFKIGAVKMSHDTNSYLIPVVINGKYKIFGRKLKIEFLEKRLISKDLDKENRNLEETIKGKLVD